MGELGRSPYHAAVILESFSDSHLAAVGEWAPRLSPLGPSIEMTSRSGKELVRIEGKRLRSPTSFHALIERPAEGSLIQPMPGNRWHHVGFHSPDFHTEVAGLEANGYVRDVWREHEGRLITFAYMLSKSGLRVELTQSPIESPPADEAVAQKMRAEMPKYEQLAKDFEAEKAAALAAGEPRERVVGRMVDHIGGVLDDPEAEAAILTDVLGIEWDDPVESEATRSDEGGSTTIVTRSMTAHGAPSLRLFHREWNGDALPVTDVGWDHVAFHASDLPGSVAELEGAGYRRLVAWTTPGEESVLLAGPEGTRVKLAAA